MRILDPKLVLTGERSQLEQLYGTQREMYNEWLRKQILVNNRVDILATHVLGYEVQPFHLNMLKFQFQHLDNLQLAFRGAGKSTICTVAKAIWYLSKWPNARLVIASKTVKQAQARLKEIKSHFEGNEKLIELFGEFVSRDVWNQREIEVAQRTSTDATPSIACVGAKGSIAGAHFDVEFSDDLIDKTNSDTEITREEVNEWYNGTFTPMLDPPDADLPYRFNRHRVGTRYHYLDQYGQWIKIAEDNLKAGVPAMGINVIPAVDPETGCSPWPKRWRVEELLKRKRNMGEIAFGAQYLCSTDAMKGEIFKYEHCQSIPEDEMNAMISKMNVYMGVDLAISEKQTADDFAIVVIGKHGTGDEARYFVLESYADKLRFNDQTAKIVEMDQKWKPKKIGLEVQGYQLAQYHNLEKHHPEIKSKIKRIRIKPHDGKVSRAWRLTPVFENKRVFFPVRSMKLNGETILETPSWKLREQLVLFPSAGHDDLFDAFDHAMTAARTSGRRKIERETVGVL